MVRTFQYHVRLNPNVAGLVTGHFAANDPRWILEQNQSHLLARATEIFSMDIMGFLWPFFLPVVALLIALVHIRWKQLTGWQAIGSVLMWQLAIGLGLGLIWAGLGHLLMPDVIAESIGWPTGSPFQREVGMWDVALGIVGVLCLVFRDEGFFTATIIGTGIFYVSAGLGHVYELIVHGDTAAFNAGAVMYIDLFYPVVLAALLILYHSKKREAERRLGS